MTTLRKIATIASREELAGYIAQKKAENRDWREGEYAGLVERARVLGVTHDQFARLADD